MEPQGLSAAASESNGRLRGASLEGDCWRDRVAKVLSNTMNLSQELPGSRNLPIDSLEESRTVFPAHGLHRMLGAAGHSMEVARVLPHHGHP